MKLLDCCVYNVEVNRDIFLRNFSSKRIRLKTDIAFDSYEIKEGVVSDILGEYEQYDSQIVFVVETLGLEPKKYVFQVIKHDDKKYELIGNEQSVFLTKIDNEN